VPEPLPLPRTRLFPLLSGPDSLVVVHGNRFSGKTTLIRTWMMTDPMPSGAVVFVETPPRGIIAAEYWWRVLASTCAHLGTAPPESGGDGVAALSSVLVAQHDPIVLVLDGCDLVGGGGGGGVEEGVGVLLRCGAPLKTIVTTRTKGCWAPLVSAGSDSTVVTSGSLAFTEEETGLFLRASGVPQRAADIRMILCRTGGLPGLVAAVCRAVKREDARNTRPDEPLERVIDAAVDALVWRTVVAEPAVAQAYRRGVFGTGTVVWDRAATAESRSALAGAAGILEAAGMVDRPPGLHERHLEHPDAVCESLRRVAGLHLRGGTRDATGMPVSPRPAVHRTRPNVPAEESVGIEDRCGRTVIGASVCTGRGHADLIVRVMGLRACGYITAATQLCDVALTDHALLTALDVVTCRTCAFHYLHIGITYLLADRHDDAISILRLAVGAGADTTLEGHVTGLLALAHAVRGDTADAGSWIDRARRCASSVGIGQTCERTAVVVATALVALDTLDIKGAEVALAELGAPHEDEELWAHILYAKGKYALLTSVPGDGLRHVEMQMRRFGPRCQGVSNGLLSVVRADLELALGRVDQASRLMAGAIDCRSAPVRARILVSEADPAGAVAVAEHYGNDPNCAPGTLLELAVVGAAAAHSAGWEVATDRFLARAGVLARQTGMVRPFTVLVPQLIDALAAHGVEFPTDVGYAPADSTTECCHDIRLTRREHQVLDALVAGGTTSTIAKAQFVSVNTVKSQMRSLYRKLGVHSRAEAIAAAHRMTVGWVSREPYR